MSAVPILDLSLLETSADDVLQDQPIAAVSTSD